MKNSNDQKSKKNRLKENKNVLETINSLGSQAIDTIKNEAKATSDEFFSQLLGQQKILNQNRSGELPNGQSLQMNEILSGKTEQKQKFEEQIFFEKQLFNTERQETSKRLQELRMRLQVIQAEAVRMVASTQKLTEEIKVAVMQGTVSASEYQINFFESIIKMVSDFRKKIDSAVTWLQGSSKRAQKKNFWSQYKKKGAGFLLSGESYSQRSAG